MTGTRRTGDFRYAAGARAILPNRHALGAHYTPRAYVERLVLPTVNEPLRAD
ncbi:MAG: type IIL restriction-modification enzyme MmeI [Lysobacterales bacterium]